MWVVDNDQNYTDGTKIKNSNLNYECIRFQFNDIDFEPGQVFKFDTKAQYPYTILALNIESDTGTITVNMAINGVQIDGLIEIDATDTLTEYTAQQNNLVEIGDTVVMETIALTDSPTQLSGNLLIKRT